MRRGRDRAPRHRCSLCGRRDWEIGDLFVGERGAICQECLAAANRVMAERS